MGAVRRLAARAARRRRPGRTRGTPRSPRPSPHCSHVSCRSRSARPSGDERGDRDERHGLAEDDPRQQRPTRRAAAAASAARAAARRRRRSPSPRAAMPEREQLGARRRPRARVGAPGRPVAGSKSRCTMSQACGIARSVVRGRITERRRSSTPSAGPKRLVEVPDRDDERRPRGRRGATARSDSRAASRGHAFAVTWSRRWGMIDSP